MKFKKKHYISSPFDIENYMLSLIHVARHAEDAFDSNISFFKASYICPISVVISFDYSSQKCAKTVSTTFASFCTLS